MTDVPATLVVIDMQELFRAASSPWHVPGFDELTEPIGRHVDAFGDRVVHTRFTLSETKYGSWGPYYERFEPVTHPENGRWFELADPHRAQARRLIERPVFNAWGDRLREIAGDPATLVLCGVATDCCVISTALPAADDGAFVRVVDDACRGSSAEAHAAAISVLGGYAPQIEITTVEAEIERRSSDAA
jgi:nicotinamidase-related amidase